MALSDDLLADRDRMKRVRSGITALAREAGASVAFLVDEAGTPFATVGHVEFRLPHPLASLVEEGGADAILGALVGEPQNHSSSVVVERLGARALLVLVLPSPPDARRRSAIVSAARAIVGSLVDSPEDAP